MPANAGCISCAHINSELSYIYCVMALVKLSVQMNDVIVTTLRNLSEQEYHCPDTLKMIADVLERSKEDSIIMNESEEEQRQDSSKKVSSVFAVSA